MRILFFVRHYFDMWGGIEENIFHLSQFLHDKHDITVTAKGEKQNNRIIEGVNYISHDKVNIHNYDIVIIENFELFPHIPLLIQITVSRFFGNWKGKVILVPHGGLTLNWSQFTFWQRIIKNTWNKIIGIPWINRYVHTIIAVSDWEKDALEKLHITCSIAVIRNGMPMHTIEQCEKKDQYFMFLGRIHPIKNIERIIDTFSLLQKNGMFVSYMLYICGNTNTYPTYVKKLQEKIQTLGLSEKVIFKGELGKEEKLRMLSHASCLFCLSHWENDPVVIKEAFSVGTKVCINPIYGLRDYREEKNVFSLTEKIISPEDFSYFLELLFDSAHIIKRESWEEVSYAYEKVFTTIIY